MTKSEREPPPVFQVAPAHRARVADQVFDALLRAILRGELRPGEPVPTQRGLSVQFGVSPLVVRQAIHRLEELELVRVRQGSTTIVLDPNEASDVRLIELQLAAATPGDSLALAGIESRTLGALPLVVLAQRRITDAMLDELESALRELGPAPTPQEMGEFQTMLWTKIAEATCNMLLRHQVRWWIRTMQSLSTRDAIGPTAGQPSFYEKLLEALRRRSGAVELFLERVNEVCDALERLPEHALQAARGNQRAEAQTEVVAKPPRRRSRPG
jgi:GntR family transcriptional regulator, transcriptional repressor for pyruvate dehydrogenase complex